MLSLPFVNSIPYLDGNIDFVKTYDFYEGGINQLFANWNSIHPPFKELLSSLSFSLFGISPFSYNVIGPLAGAVCLGFYFAFSKKFINESVAKIATLLLATSPLFVGVGVFSLTDFLVTVLIVASLYFYLSKRFAVFALCASLAVLTKETVLVFVFSIILPELLFYLKDRKNPSKLFILAIPFVALFSWFKFLEVSGKTPWGDWNFSEVAQRGTFYTIFYNLITFNFLNKYAYQNWQQLTILNFNWVYWVGMLVGIFPLKNLKQKIKEVFAKPTPRNKTFLSLFFFFILYFISVLSFQTYTIPRYGLPLVPIILLLLAYFLNKKRFLFPLIAIITLLQLFFSLDPITRALWGKTKILGEDLYSLNTTLAGNDGITYNVQYLLLVKRRTQIIFSEGLGEQDCYWLFPDPNNDRKTARILKLENLSVVKRCLNF